MDYETTLRKMIFLGYSFVLIDKLNKFSTVQEIEPDEAMQTKRLHGDNAYHGKATPGNGNANNDSSVVIKKEFSYLNKKKCLIMMVKNSINMNMYEVTYEIIRVFMQDLLTYQNTGIFEVFFD